MATRSKRLRTSGRMSHKQSDSSDSDSFDDESAFTKSVASSKCEVKITRPSRSCKNDVTMKETESDDEFAKSCLMFPNEASAKKICKKKNADVEAATETTCDLSEKESPQKNKKGKTANKKKNVGPEYRIQFILGMKTCSAADWRTITDAMPNTYEVTRGSVWQQPDEEYYCDLPQYCKDSSKNANEMITKYLIKWQHASYMHVSWETEKDLMEMIGGQDANESGSSGGSGNSRELTHVQTNLKKFYARVNSKRNSSTALFDDLGLGEYFPKSFLQIERILDIDDPSVNIKKMPWKTAKMPKLNLAKECSSEHRETCMSITLDEEEDLYAALLEEDEAVDSSSDMEIDKPNSGNESGTSCDLIASELLSPSCCAPTWNKRREGDTELNGAGVTLTNVFDEVGRESHSNSNSNADDSSEFSLMELELGAAEAEGPGEKSLNPEVPDDDVELFDMDESEEKLPPSSPTIVTTSSSDVDPTLATVTSVDVEECSNSITISKAGYLHSTNENMEQNENESQDVSCYVVVKWAGLPYECISLEDVCDLQRCGIEYEDALRQFYAREQMKPVSKVQSKRSQLLNTNCFQEVIRQIKLFNESHEAPSDVETNSDSKTSIQLGGLPRDYQWEGIKWLLFNYSQRRNSILADEMGLGKTIQSSVFLHLLKTHFQCRGPFLVVAPLSTIIQWQREIIQWTELDVLVYHGSQEDKHIMRQMEFQYANESGQKTGQKGKKKSEGYKIEVIITTPETAIAFDVQQNANGTTSNRSSSKRILSQNIFWEMVIVDEAHKLKNSESKLTNVLRDEYRYRNCLLLTGTPIQNNTEELWTLLNFVDRERFNDKYSFMDEFGTMSDYEQLNKLQTQLKPYILRREKDDVEKSVPPKEEVIIEVELTVSQKQYYRAIYEQNTAFLYKGQARDGPRLSNLAMELRKCCLHPYLIKGAQNELSKYYVGEKEMTPLETLIQCSGKLTLLDKLLPKLQADGHRVLIFSQFRMMLDIIEDYMIAKGCFTFDRVDGAVTGRHRQAAIDRFMGVNQPVGETATEAPKSVNKQYPGLFAMLLSTRAGGVGINLTAADTVILFDSDWNPQNDIQAQARAHRIGQTKHVKVYRLLARGTYEMLMFKAASMKLGLDYAVMHNLNVKPASVAPEAGNMKTIEDHPSPTEVETGSRKRGKKSEQPILKKGATNDDVLQSVIGTDKSAATMSSLSKKELEYLLKHGAYDIFREANDGTADMKSRQFSEANIDDILSRSSMFVHGEGEGGDEARQFKQGNDGATGGGTGLMTGFSKASFVINEDNADDAEKPTHYDNISLDDEDFWSKVVGLASGREEIEEVSESEVESGDEDSVSKKEKRLEKRRLSRMRKFSKRKCRTAVEDGFYREPSASISKLLKENDGNSSESDSESTQMKWNEASGLKLIQTLCTVGYGQWEELHEEFKFPRGVTRCSVSELKTICQELLLICLYNSVRFHAIPPDSIDQLCGGESERDASKNNCLSIQSLEQSNTTPFLKISKVSDCLSLLEAADRDQSLNAVVGDPSSMSYQQALFGYLRKYRMCRLVLVELLTKQSKAKEASAVETATATVDQNIESNIMVSVGENNQLCYSSPAASGYDYLLLDEWYKDSSNCHVSSVCEVFVPLVESFHLCDGLIHHIPLPPTMSLSNSNTNGTIATLPTVQSITHCIQKWCKTQLNKLLVLEDIFELHKAFDYSILQANEKSANDQGEQVTVEDKTQHVRANNEGIQLFGNIASMLEKFHQIAVDDEAAQWSSQNKTGSADNDNGVEDLDGRTKPTSSIVDSGHNTKPYPLPAKWWSLQSDMNLILVLDALQYFQLLQDTYGSKKSLGGGKGARVKSRVWEEIEEELIEYEDQQQQSRDGQAETEPVAAGEGGTISNSSSNDNKTIDMKRLTMRLKNMISVLRGTFIEDFESEQLMLKRQRDIVMELAAQKAQAAAAAALKKQLQQEASAAAALAKAEAAAAKAAAQLAKQQERERQKELQREMKAKQLEQELALQKARNAKKIVLNAIRTVSKLGRPRSLYDQMLTTRDTTANSCSHNISAYGVTWDDLLRELMHVNLFTLERKKKTDNESSETSADTKHSDDASMDMEPAEDETVSEADKLALMEKLHVVVDTMKELYHNPDLVANAPTMVLESKRGRGKEKDASVGGAEEWEEEAKGNSSVDSNEKLETIKGISELEDSKKMGPNTSATASTPTAVVSADPSHLLFQIPMKTLTDCFDKLDTMHKVRLILLGFTSHEIINHTVANNSIMVSSSLNSAVNAAKDMAEVMTTTVNNAAPQLEMESYGEVATETTSTTWSNILVFIRYMSKYCSGAGHVIPIYKRDTSLPVWWTIYHDYALLHGVLRSGIKDLKQLLSEESPYCHCIKIYEDVDGSENNGEDTNGAVRLKYNLYLHLNRPYAQFTLPAKESGMEWILDMNVRILEKRLSTIIKSLYYTQVLHQQIDRLIESQLNAAEPPKPPPSPIPHHMSLGFLKTTKSNKKAKANISNNTISNSFSFSKPFGSSGNSSTSAAGSISGNGMSWSKFFNTAKATEKKIDDGATAKEVLTAIAPELDEKAIPLAPVSDCKVEVAVDKTASVMDVEVIVVDTPQHASKTISETPVETAQAETITVSDPAEAVHDVNTPSKSNPSMDFVAKSPITVDAPLSTEKTGKRKGIVSGVGLDNAKPEKKQKTSSNLKTTKSAADNKKMQNTLFQFFKKTPVA